MAVTPAPPNPPSPPAATEKGFLRRNLRFFLAANLAVGVYVLLKTLKKESSEKGEEAAKMVPAAPVTIEPTTPDQKTVVATATVTPPTKVLPPITEQEQRELFKWILEEKRKVKLNTPDEKKKIEEEKALLKQLIRAKSIPKIHETHLS